VEIVLNSPEDVRLFLQKEFMEIRNSDSVKDGILGNLSYETRNERFRMINEKLDSICKKV